MSIKKTTTYHCDVCATQIDIGDSATLPLRNTGVFKVFFDGEWTSEVAISWDHFCHSCRGRLINFASKIKDEVTS